MNGIEVLEREVVFHRYYDPSTAQFLSVDPLVAATGQPYAYTKDNPVNGTDPQGLMTIGGYCAPGDCPTVDGTNDPIQSAPSGSTVGSSGDTTWNGGMNYSPTASQSSASVSSTGSGSPSSAPTMIHLGLLNILSPPPPLPRSPTPPNLFQWIFGFVARNYKALATVAAGVICISSGLGTVICLTAGAVATVVGLSSDLVHHCPAANTAVDVGIDFVGMGTAGLVSLGAQALRGAGLGYKVIYAGATGAIPTSVAAVTSPC